ncbi:PAS domain-containing protein [Alphaproteobacteria bacterium GH1-50]|uniref:PAS domain-containing protein n=1 Tax=Kangsaoukella pontilimi TaxID=2691042 RepID=A0A7C9MF12_9RHOB|nr:PAS domain-containing protein [Kangsaoukella pontilimi]MXQ07456.1 PAS domain-containing protein [Kangsaoukella pontilimi]
MQDTKAAGSSQPLSFQDSADVLMVCAQSANVAPWAVDPVTRDAWWSDHFYAMLGYERDGFAAHSLGFRALIHPDDLETAVRSMLELSEGRIEHYRTTFRLRRKDGNWNWYESTARMTEGPDGKPLICGGLKDVQCLKVAELERDESLARAEAARIASEASAEAAVAAKASVKVRENMLRLALTNGKQTAWSSCRETGQAWMMDEGYDLLGYSPDEFTPNADGWRSITHPDDLDASVGRINEAIAGRADSFESTHRFRHKDGTYHWYRVVGRILTSQDGVPTTRLAGTIANVDELKENEQRAALAREQAENARAQAIANEEMLRTSASCGGIGPWTVVPATGEAWMLDETYRLLGYEPGSFSPKASTLRALIHPYDLNEATSTIDAMLAGSLDVFDRHLRLRHGDGSYHWYKTVARRTTPATSDTATVVSGTITGIDDLKRKETELARAVEEAEDLRRQAQQSAEILRVSSVNSGVVPWFRIPDLDEFWFSENINQLLGYTGPDRVTLEKWVARIHPEDLPDVMKRIEAVENFETEVFHAEFRTQRFDGTWFWCRSVGQRIRRTATGQPDMICGSQYSIDELKQNEIRQMRAAEDLQKANARLRSVADNAPAGIYEYRRFADGSFQFPYSSARFNDLFGITEDQIREDPTTIFARVHPDDFGELEKSIIESQEKLMNWTHRFRAIHPERGLRWLSGSSSPMVMADGSIGWTGVLSDVTEDVERESALREAHETAEKMRIENERLALHDPLTNLPNRRYFDKTFEDRQLRAEESSDGDFCLLRIDLDKFKYINDTLGHDTGDAALCHVAGIIRDCIGPEDFAARIGGDEFSVILAAGRTEADAGALATKISGLLREPVQYGTRKLHLGASFGVAHTQDLVRHGRDIEFFADTALYKAKENGRNRVQVFTPALLKNVIEDRELSADLQDALGSNAFVPYFQPQVSARDGSLAGIETLLRWQHPRLGLLVPGRFIHLAEQMRILPQIDMIAFRTALEFLSDLEMEGLFVPKASFNISSGRMRDARIVEDARRHAAISRTQIVFELLESILVENESDEFKANIRAVRDLGIEIEVDDFGAGHASIISIMEIAPSALKIDRRLVQPISEHQKHLDVIKGVIKIAKSLGVSTTAEGVETAEQARLLTEAGCQTLQGYHFARPLSPHDLRALLIARKNDPDHGWQVPAREADTLRIA